MSENLVLWGVGTPRTLRAHWALHELGLRYTSRPILPRSGETKTPEYTALNPRQKIPLLQDGDFTIGESAASRPISPKNTRIEGPDFIPRSLTRGRGGLSGASL